MSSIPERAEQAPPKRSRGRPQTVSRDAIAAAGLDLFLRDGFERTTMTQIAAEAAVGRKTLFTYFPNKADIVWNRFERQLHDLSASLESAPPDMSSTDAALQAVMRALHTYPAAVPVMRAEVTLIQETPELQSYAFMRGRPWRDAIAAFLAERERMDPRGVLPEVAGHGYWHAMFIGFREWLASEDHAPRPHVERALREYSAAVRAAFDAAARA